MSAFKYFFVIFMMYISVTLSDIYSAMFWSFVTGIVLHADSSGNQ